LNSDLYRARHPINSTSIETRNRRQIAKYENISSPRNLNLASLKRTPLTSEDMK